MEARVEALRARCIPRGDNLQMLAPILAELAQDYKGKVFFGKIDIDRNPRITAQFGVQSVPMVAIFQNGKPVGMLPGLRNYNEYDMLIERFN